MAHAPGHQQAHPRRGPLRRRRVGVLAGLAPGEALLPHRPPHRDRRGHARHRRAGAQLRRRSARKHTQPGRRSPRRSAGSCPSRRRRSSGSARTRVDELRRKVNLLRDATRSGPGRAAQVARPAGHAGRGHRQPRRPPHRRRHRGRVARRRHLPGVVASTSTSTLWEDAMAAPRPVDRLVRAPPPHRGRGPARGTTSRPGSTRTSSGSDWQDALAEAGLQDCRWTPCYDCGACTGYGIEHVVASPTPPAGGSQGTGPGPDAAAARCRSTLLPARPCRRSVRSEACRRPVHQAGQDPLDQPPRRRPHVGARLPADRSCPLAYTEGFSPRPKVSFGLALPTGAESVAEYLDVELGPTARTLDVGRALPAAVGRRSRSASTCTRPPSIDDRAPSLQQEVIVVHAGSSGSSGAGHDELRERWPPSSLRRRRLVVTRERKGTRRHRRHPARHPRACEPSTGVELESAELATQPRGLRPAELLRPSAPASRRLGAQDPPMDRARRRARGAPPTRRTRSTCALQERVLMRREHRRCPSDLRTAGGARSRGHQRV